MFPEKERKYANKNILRLETEQMCFLDKGGMQE
jgi:hypothetical protein